MNGYDEGIDLKEIFGIVRKYIKSIIIIPIIFGIIGFSITNYAIEPKYESATTLLVNSSKLSEETITQSDVTLSKSLIYTYAEIAKSETILKKMMAKLNIEKKDICELNITPLKDTQVMQIKVQALSPFLAADISNTIAEEFSKEVKRIAKVDSVEIIDIADPNLESVYPNVAINTIISFIIGEMLTFLVIFIVHFANGKIKTETDIEKYVETPVLGTVVKYNTTQYENSKIIMMKDPISPVCELYRNIRSSILFSNIDDNLKKILITSSNKSEGKTTLVCNLAYAFAEQGYKVALVDCDLRRPSVHRKFKVSNLQGLTDILLKKDDYKEYLYHINENLDILVSGKKPNNPSEIVGSNAMSKLLDEISKDYDYLLIDAPPLIVSDPIVMTQIVDGLIYVVESGKIEREIVKKNIGRLKNTGVNVIGCVLNNMNIKEHKYGYYYYDTYYGEEINKKSRRKSKAF